MTERLLHLGHPEHHIPGYEYPEAASKPPSRKRCAVGFLCAAAIALIGWWLKHVSEGAVIPSVELWAVAPFVLLLGCIAVAPFIAKHFWEKNYHFVSVGLGAAVTAYYAFALRHTGGTGVMAETFADYISFIFLLGSLFVVSGGVMIRVPRSTTPAANTLLLVSGALLANLFGTTGASMLLIRPYLRLNKGRTRPYHIVFFIFIVANVGGALTPVGDPPLFLGYLRGVPFWWVLEQCWPIWATAIGCLAAIFFVIDARNGGGGGETASGRNGETAKQGVQGSSPIRPLADSPVQPISILGGANLLFVALILVAVFCDSPWREILMAAAAFGSLATTSPRIYGENHFNFAPIREVALLFIGIFATMVPAMNYLHNHASDPAFRRFLHSPGQFYFASGSLSSVLDNAPTYITFFETALGKSTGEADIIGREKAVAAAKRIQLSPADLAGLDAADTRKLEELHATLVRYHGKEILAGTLQPEEVEVAFMLDDSGHLTDGTFAMYKFLMAISIGAVFFGACTYIGNGPNFMVKSIAEHAGIKTPGFFRYILCYTLPILLPILVLCWFVFLRH